MHIGPNFFAGLFFSLLESSALTLLALSIYRIPVMMYWERLVVIQFVLLGVSVFFEQVLQDRNYFTLTVAVVGIILLTILLKIPVLYSSLIWGTGYLLMGIVQLPIVLAFTGFGSITAEQLQSTYYLKYSAMLLTFLIMLLVVYFINKKRLGFMFIMNRFRLQKRGIKIKDYFVAVFFICTVSLLQMAVDYFFSDESNLTLIVVLGSMVVISLIGLYVTYVFNMREIDERFSSLRKKL